MLIYVAMGSKINCDYICMVILEVINGIVMGGLCFLYE